LGVWRKTVSKWRKVIRRGNFCSAGDLKEKIEAFINYFNRTMAKPLPMDLQGETSGGRFIGEQTYAGVN